MINLDPYWQIEDSALALYLDGLHRIDFSQISLSEKDFPKQKLQISNGIAIIPIKGLIVPRQDIFSFLMGAISIEEIRLNLNEALSNKKVNSILLTIDSPGGLAQGIDEMSFELFSAAQVKPMISQVEGVMASAALSLGVQANKVFASGRAAEVGSIGTRLVLTDSSEAAKKEGIKVISIDTGKMKSLGVPGLPITEAQIKKMQAIVDKLQSFFDEAVIRGRGFSEKQLAKVKDGSIFLAEEGLNKKLIDGIQPLEVTITNLLQQEQVKTDLKRIL